MGHKSQMAFLGSPVQLHICAAEQVEHVSLPRYHNPLSVNRCSTRSLLEEAVVTGTGQLRAPPLVKKVDVLEA